MHLLQYWLRPTWLLTLPCFNSLLSFFDYLQKFLIVSIQTYFTSVVKSELLRIENIILEILLLVSWSVTPCQWLYLVLRTHAKYRYVKIMMLFYFLHEKKVVVVYIVSYTRIAAANLWRYLEVTSVKHHNTDLKQIASRLLIYCK